MNNWFFGLASKNKKKNSIPKTITMLMHSFKLSPLDVYGGEFKITGKIGSDDVDLIITVPAMNSTVFKDMLGFLKDKAEMKRKQYEKAKRKRR